MGMPPIRFKLINTVDQVRQLKSDWECLYKEINDCNVFQSWDWNYAWIETVYNPNLHNLHIVCGYADEELILLLPLVQKISKDDQLEFGFIAQGFSDYSDILIHPDLQPNSSKLILRAIRKFNLTPWRLRFLPEWSPINLLIAETKYNKNWHFVEDEELNEEVFSKIELPKSIEEYFHSLSKNNRKNIRRAIRLIESKNIQIEFHRKLSDEMISRLINFHIDNLKKNHQITSTYANVFHRNFLQKALKNMSDNKILMLVLLMDNQRWVVSDLLIVKGNWWIGYLTGMDRDYAELSPGRVSIFYTIKKAIETGVDVYDFGWGDESYKNYWNANVWTPISGVLSYQSDLQRLVNDLRKKIRPRTRIRQLVDMLKNTPNLSND
jgi:CelD/BcsL family acetyltransferase involved in cellulose biosynthesis